MGKIKGGLKAELLIVYTRKMSLIMVRSCNATLFCLNLKK